VFLKAQRHRKTNFGFSLAEHVFRGGLALFSENRDNFGSCCQCSSWRAYRIKHPYIWMRLCDTFCLLCCIFFVVSKQVHCTYTYKQNI